MKKPDVILALLLFGAVLWMGSSYEAPSQYTPIFMERAELEKSVSYVDKGRKMENPGKIVVRGSRLFVNEKYKGVHIIDNSDPINPVMEAFLVAPGCIDMAVKGNMVYLDNAVDLVAFDLDTKTVTERIKNFMPEHPHPEGSGHRLPSRPEDFILVGWKTYTNE